MNMEVKTKMKAKEESNYIKVAEEKMYYKRENVEYTCTLEKVTADELVELRLGEKPGIIIKNNGELWYAKGNRKMTLVSLDDHKCNTCRRCMPTSDEDGGCAKVRDVSAERISRQDCPDVRELVEFSKRLEKYEFITSGIETFNVEQEALLVLTCENFQDYEKKEPKTLEQIISIKQGILDFYNDGCSL